VAAVIAVLVILPSREVHIPARAPSLRSFWAVLSRRDVLLPSVLSMVFQYANWATTFGFVPILAQGLGASDVILSLMLSMNILVISLGNLATTAMVIRFGERNMVYASFVLIVLGVAGSAAAPTLGWLFVAQLCIGLSQGVGYPVLMGLSIRDVEESQRTTAMGLHQSIYAIGMFAGPAFTGMLAAATGIPTAFYVTATVTLVIGLAGTRLMRGGGAQHA